MHDASEGTADGRCSVSAVRGVTRNMRKERKKERKKPQKKRKRKVREFAARTTNDERTKTGRRTFWSGGYGWMVGSVPCRFRSFPSAGPAESLSSVSFSLLVATPRSWHAAAGERAAIDRRRSTEAVVVRFTHLLFEHRGHNARQLEC